MGLSSNLDCEEKLRELSGRGHVVLASRATMALVAVLRALDLPPESEVLIPVTLCANPATAVRLAGLRPLFADIDPHSFNMDPDAAEKVVGPNTRVLLAVPLFGYPLDCAQVLAFAERYNLIVIEDAAQAVGLRHTDRPAGTLGLCSLYSFGRGKIADAGGGAAILSDDASFIRCAGAELESISPAGQRTIDREELAAALGDLPRELEGRSRLVTAYRDALATQGIEHPDLPPGTPLWKYSMLLPTRPERDLATRALLAAGIEATNLYPPLARHFPSARNAFGRFPVAEDVYDRIVNLSLWPNQVSMAQRAANAIGFSIDA